MLHIANGSERTLAQFVELFDESGWEVVRVHTGFGTQDVKIVGVPTKK